MSADKRIPVTEERWKELHGLKKPGQTYDELLEELVHDHWERNRRELAERMRETDEMDTAEFVPLRTADE